MKRFTLFACIGFFGLTQIASAASVTFGTVGTVNGNGKTITEAGGNTITSSNFSLAVGAAFDNDYAGVWNFDGADFHVNNGETVTLNYGLTQSKTEVLTFGASQEINRGSVAGEATSGAFELGLGGDASTRTFTLSMPVVTLGIFNTNRGDGSRSSVLTVTFKDGTFASTTGANGGATYFQGFTTTLANPIVSFSLAQSNFIRYDDLGFVVPEPTGLSFLGLGAFVACRRKRRLGV